MVQRFKIVPLIGNIFTVIKVLIIKKESFMIREIEFLDQHLRSLGFEEEHLLDDHTILSTYCLNEGELAIRVTVCYRANDGFFEFDTHEIEINSAFGFRQHQISRLSGLKDLVEYLRNLTILGVSGSSTGDSKYEEGCFSVN